MLEKLHENRWENLWENMLEKLHANILEN